MRARTLVDMERFTDLQKAGLVCSEVRVTAQTLVTLIWQFLHFINRTC